MSERIEVMSIENGLAIETYDTSWMIDARQASETLYPGLLDKLDIFQAEGDRAAFNSAKEAAGIEVASDSSIAQLWQLSKFDERAHDEMSRMVEAGLCTRDDIAAVFFKMTEVGLF